MMFKENNVLSLGISEVIYLEERKSFCFYFNVFGHGHRSDARPFYIPISTPKKDMGDFSVKEISNILSIFVSSIRDGFNNFNNHMENEK